jgi:DNA-binding CsgD family transcriptional regulator
MQMSARTKTDQHLIDLFPVGLVLVSHRKIRVCNDTFAGMFGYHRQDLEGCSIERLYPSRREFIDIGARWLDTLRHNEHIGDERIMLAKGDVPIWFSAKGRSTDRRDPFSLIACVFEPRQTLSARAIALSPREREIVAAMGEGLTSKEIARQLGLSYRSVETYRSRLLAKFKARNASQLIDILRKPLA